MTNKETIEKYLDKCEITPGEWENHKQTIDSKWQIRGSNSLVGIFNPYHGEDKDIKVLAASRNMLVALILSYFHMIKAVDEVEGCPYDNCSKHKDGSQSCKYEDCIHYLSCEITKQSIEQALSRPWEEIRKELEEMEEKG